MTDLREQVARRLAEVIEPWSDRLLDHDGWLQAQADEVIRIAEWARRRALKAGLVSQTLREGLVTDSASGEEEITRILAERPLTLPPPDWKP